MSKITVTLRGSVQSHWPCLVWQELFKLYREKGGSLEHMSNMLIDYKNCEKWLEKHEPSPYCLFSFDDSSWYTNWREFDDQEKLQDYQWLAHYHDNTYMLEYKRVDEIELVEIVRMIPQEIED